MERDIGQAAVFAAGNWKKFHDFCWFGSRDIPDAHEYTLVYTVNRDSGLIDQSNDVAIHNALVPYMEGKSPDVIPQHHSHWACGWVEGHAIRVFRDGVITDAFKAYHALQMRLADYPILDEDDYCTRENDATIENIESAAWSIKKDYDLPNNWAHEVYRWLWDHDDSAVENRDDQGGYPSDEQLRTAFDALFSNKVAV